MHVFCLPVWLTDTLVPLALLSYRRPLQEHTQSTFVSSQKHSEAVFDEKWDKNCLWLKATQQYLFGNYSEVRMNRLFLAALTLFFSLAPSFAQSQTSMVIDSLDNPPS